MKKKSCANPVWCWLSPELVVHAREQCPILQLRLQQQHQQPGPQDGTTSSGTSPSHVSRKEGLCEL